MHSYGLLRTQTRRRQRRSTEDATDVRSRRRVPQQAVSKDAVLWLSLRVVISHKLVISRRGAIATLKKGGVYERMTRTYEVRVFVPTILAIEADNEKDALAKVGELYKELYAKDARTWIE